MWRNGSGDCTGAAGSERTPCGFGVCCVSQLSEPPEEEPPRESSRDERCTAGRASGRDRRGQVPESPRLVEIRLCGVSASPFSRCVT